jgi:hypothetical protein
VSAVPFDDNHWRPKYVKALFYIKLLPLMGFATHSYCLLPFLVDTGSGLAKAELLYLNRDILRVECALSDAFE